MTCIAEKFSQLQREARKGFIPFITAGDPSLDATVEIVLALERAGASMVELGVPFSDPLADGPVIQRASERALKNQVNLTRVLATVSEIRRRSEVPILLFTYLNPVWQFGVEKFARAAHCAGVDGVLFTDLTPEESDNVLPAMQGHQLEVVFLAAPTSTDARLKLIGEKSSGFIYAVSRLGVTGTREELARGISTMVSRVRKFSSLPVAVGFGVSSAEHVGEIWKFADAAVVGSAIVSFIEQNAFSPRLIEDLEHFVRSLIPS